MDFGYDLESIRSFKHKRNSPFHKILAANVSFLGDFFGGFDPTSLFFQISPFVWVANWPPFFWE